MSKLWEEIRRISDELEVKLEKASVEAKDRWQALKPRVKDLHAKMDEKATQASDRVVEELNNVGTLIKELRDDVLGPKKPNV